MKAIKWMLFGIALLLLGICGMLGCALDGGGGSVALGLLCPLFGILICILAVSKKD